MKMTKRTLLITILIASLTLSSCGGFASTGKDLMAGVEAAEWPESADSPSVDFIRAVNRFSWNMAATREKEAGNWMISPASVYLALAMTLNGADRQTKTDMLKALSSQDLTLEAVNKAARDWMIRLDRKDAKSRLSIVNSIWYRKDFSADPGFLQRNADFFRSEIRSLDFSDSQSADVINRWVEKATEGRIDKIIETIDRDTVMFLINAIYFKAEWQIPFLPHETHSGSFQSPYGVVPTNFMKRAGSMDFIETPDTQGVVLPYKDSRLAFVALLPREGKTLEDLVRSLAPAGMDAMMKERHAEDIALQIPAFESEYKDLLKDTLTDLGMGIAFTGSADFSRMQANRVKDIAIVDVLHKTFIRVNENGTEAAAVTKVEASSTSSPTGKTTLTFDRPFLYCIVDLDTNLPLFIGKIEKPDNSK